MLYCCNDCDKEFVLYEEAWTRCKDCASLYCPEMTSQILETEEATHGTSGTK